MRVCKHLCVFAYVVLQCAGARAAAQNTLPVYPYAWRDENVVDDYHGTKIKDPYRWLEEPLYPETKQFVKAQNLITQSYLQECLANHNVSREALSPEEVVNGSATVFVRAGHRYFSYKRLNLLCVQDSLDGERRVFMNFTELLAGGYITLSKHEFSPDGSVFVYGLSVTGSDWITLHFKDVATGQNYPEKLEKIKYSKIAWTKDNKGVFYSAYRQQLWADGSNPDLHENHKLYYHRLNTSQADDVVIIEFPSHPLWAVNAIVTDGGQYLLVTIYRQPGLATMHAIDISKYSSFNRSLPFSLNEWRNSSISSALEYVTMMDQSICVFKTGLNAPNYKLVAVDLKNPAQNNWRTLVPEHRIDVMVFATAIDNDKLFLRYSRNVKNVIILHDLRTGAFLQEIDLDVGMVVDSAGRKDHSEIFFQFSSFFTPSIIYYIDFKSPEPYILQEYSKTTLKGIDPSLYETKQIFYSSKDCTKVPMYIISKKGLPMNGSNPTLLYGYGGFNIISEPSYDLLWLTFVHRLQGVFAMANIRGGGEHGLNWYYKGRYPDKQNAFDDFQAAAKYLIRAKYTRPELLTIQGSSHGGLLVAACITQRPALYGVAIMQSGKTDLLRHHKFTGGYLSAAEYGVADNKKQFDNLIKHSPLHNILPPGEGRAQYPATLVLTGDHDDRVVPLHSLKFIAALQHAVRGSNQTRPLLARIYKNIGHSTSVLGTSDILCFIMQALNLKLVT